METTLSASIASPGVAGLANLATRRVYTALTFAICIAWLIVIAPQFLNDPDTLWHIRAARDIWQTGHFPVTDSYSHSYFGQPWIAKEWLAQLLLFAAHAIGGWNAVTWLAILSIAATGTLLFWYLSLRLNPTLAIVVALVAVFASSQTYLARPHVLAFPILVIWTEHVMRASERDRPPSLVLVPLMIIWANVNGSFMIGLVIAGFAFLNFLQRAKDRIPAGILAWLVFLVASLLATIVHPYGIVPLLTAIRVFSGNDWLKLEGEWRPVDVGADPFHELLLLGLLAALLVGGLKLRLSKAAFVLVLLHLFLAHVRFAHLFYFLVPFACSYEIARQHPRLAAASHKSGPPGGPFALLAKYSWLLVAALLLLPTALSMRLLLASPAHPPADIAPVAALDFARSANMSGNVLNTREFGGYLIFEGVKTFIDGRSDQLFDNAFLADELASMRPGGEEALSRLIERYQIAWTLFRVSDPRSRMMDRQPSFRRAYQDESAVVHMRLN